MKEYIKPSIELINMETNDVILSSNFGSSSSSDTIVDLTTNSLKDIGLESIWK